MDVLGGGGRAASGLRTPVREPKLLELPQPLSLDSLESGSEEEADGRQLPSPGTYARVTS